MSENLSESWRKCSSCKKPIDFGAKYFACSVSTCNNLRTGYVFCSVHCFERHLPGARHKDAAAIEKTADRAPSTGSLTSSQNSSSTSSSSLARPAANAGASSPEQKNEARRVFANPAPSAKPQASQIPREVLVIASRLKEYIQARADYNTSASVYDVLSDHLRIVCDRGIDNARAEGRKTVMDRDFAFLKNS